MRARAHGRRRLAAGAKSIRVVLQSEANKNTTCSSRSNLNPASGGRAWHTQVERLPAADAAVLTMAARSVCGTAACQAQAEHDAAAIDGDDSRRAQRGEAGAALAVQELQAVDSLCADVRKSAARKSASTGMGYLPASVPVSMPILGAAAWSHFGRLLPLADGDALAGAAKLPPIVRAVNLALVRACLPSAREE